MHFLVYFIVSLVLICIQTTILPEMPHVFAQFDLLIPLVVYLTLFRSSIGVLPVVLVAGCLMDLLSGGWIGVYISAYLAVYLCFRNAMLYFHFQNAVMFQIVIFLSVVIENLIFGIMISLQAKGVHFSLFAVRVLGTQFFWTLVIGPVLYLILDYMFIRVDKLIVGGLRERV